MPNGDWHNEWANAGTLKNGATLVRARGPVDLDTDTDGDGIADWWEIGFFGDLSPTADGDGDLDGLGNLTEYLAGTNPLKRFTSPDGIEDKFRDPDGDGLTFDFSRQSE